jgi:hypothetical protein
MPMKSQIKITPEQMKRIKNILDEKIDTIDKKTG